MDPVLARMFEHWGCGVSFAKTWIIYFDFADDTVIFAETTEVLAEALESLSEGAEPLVLRVF